MVQGVGFRHTACCVAKSLGVTGWVRNLPNGHVELVAEGPEKDLRQLIVRVSVETFGNVDDYQLEKSPATGQYSGFAVRRA